MMKISAGLLLYRRSEPAVQLFLVHPGGPFWKNKDGGAWSIPKGELNGSEEPLEAARREFREETGLAVEGTFTPLTPVRQKSGKLVMAFALEHDIDPSVLVSNTIKIEWPPRSGRLIDIPEVDRGEWFSVENARNKINSGQLPIIEELLSIIFK